MKKQRRKNPKNWCNSDIYLTREDLENFSKKYKSHIHLLNAYKGEGCWDLNLVILAYIHTMDESGTLGKFPNFPHTLLKKLYKLEDFVISQYLAYQYDENSEFVDKKYADFLKRFYSKKI